MCTNANQREKHTKRIVKHPWTATRTNLLHDLVPIRMFRPGVGAGVVRTGVGVTKPNGEYMCTSVLVRLSLFLCDELTAQLNGDIVPFVRRLWPRDCNLTFYKHSANLTRNTASVSPVTCTRKLDTSQNKNSIHICTAEEGKRQKFCTKCKWPLTLVHRIHGRGPSTALRKTDCDSPTSEEWARGHAGDPFQQKQIL